MAGISKPRTANWQDEIIAAVIANFFYAIDRQALEIWVDSGEDTHFINHETLPDLLADKGYQDLEDAVLSAHSYYGAIKKGHERDKTLSLLKHCKLWTCVGEGLPRKVAIVRQTGMLITDNLSRLRQWTGYAEFAGVCVCDSDEGNTLLRGMENPEHNDFHPPRLKEEEAKGKKALLQLTKWIRDAVKEHAGQAEVKTDEIDELAELLPDLDPQELLPGEGDERDFEGDSHWSLKPIRARPKLPPLFDEEEDGEGEEDGGGNGGEGQGTDGEGKGGKEKGVRRGILAITAVRILPVKDDRRRKTVLFTPLESGTGRLTISVAGDSYVEHLLIEQANPSVRAGRGFDLSVTKNKRVRLEVQLSEPIDDSLTVSLAKRIKLAEAGR